MYTINIKLTRNFILLLRNMDQKEVDCKIVAIGMPGCKLWNSLQGTNKQDDKATNHKIRKQSSL